jgi:hypothetical protein
MSCSARMTRCPADCLHRQFVMDYRRERQRSERAAVESSNGYAAELADYVDRASLPTFKDWLLGTKRPLEDREMSVAALSSVPGWEL